MLEGGIAGDGPADPQRLAASPDALDQQPELVESRSRSHIRCGVPGDRDDELFGQLLERSRKVRRALHVDHSTSGRAHERSRKLETDPDGAGGDFERERGRRGTEKQQSLDARIARDGYREVETQSLEPPNDRAPPSGHAGTQAPVRGCRGIVEVAAAKREGLVGGAAIRAHDEGLRNRSRLVNRADRFLGRFLRWGPLAFSPVCAAGSRLRRTDASAHVLRVHVSRARNGAAPRAFSEIPLPRTTKPHPTAKKRGRTAKDRVRRQPDRKDAASAAASRTNDAADTVGGVHDDGEEPREDVSSEEQDSDVVMGDADDETAQDVEPDGTPDDASPAMLAKMTKEAEVASIERFDPLSVYLREVQKHPLLTPEETHSLAERFVATQDPAVAARLVTSNLRLVVKIAYEYRRAYRNIMDLIQEGNIGLMQAVKRYDPYRGVKLSSYAAWWIRAYILRFILNNWRLVKLGTTQAQRKLFFNLRKKRAELQAMGVDPTNAEIAKQLNVPESEVADMDVRLQSSERSLDAPIGEGEGRTTAKIDTIQSTVEGPEALMAGSELQGLLKEKLASFRSTLVGKEKELAIFDERLASDEPLTLQELGDRFGISRERVRQLEQRLTGRLREFLRDQMGDAVELT